MNTTSIIKKGLYIPCNNDINPYQIDYSLDKSFNDFLKSKLNTQFIDHRYCSSFKSKYGYILTLFCKDLDIKDNDLYNKKGSLIAQTEIFGDCIIVDDSIDLNLDDLTIILNYSLTLNYKLLNDKDAEIYKKYLINDIENTKQIFKNHLKI